MKPSIRWIGPLAVMILFVFFLYSSGPAGCGKENCGNNVLDEGEACDDGNTDDGDGCSSSCEIEEPSGTGGDTGGTTGGTTTGGGTTGGTTGGSGDGSCTTDADCPSSLASPAVCDDPETCQGHRVEAKCTPSGVCQATSIPDDSACTPDVVIDCDPFPDVNCTGTPTQTPPACPEPEICNDLIDNDLDTFVDCDDSPECDGEVCAGGICSGGNCVD
jgi:cysteine-rich repeat protein